jgi:hypothetical protein
MGQGIAVCFLRINNYVACANLLLEPSCIHSLYYNLNIQRTHAFMMKPVIHPKSIEWWFWPVIFVFMLSGMFGWSQGFYAVIIFSATQSVYFIIKIRSLRAFPSQVRFVYFLFTLIGMLDPTRIWYGLMTISTFMVAFFDKCLLARMLILMPWNKDVTPSWKEYFIYHDAEPLRSLRPF